MWCGLVSLIYFSWELCGVVHITVMDRSEYVSKIHWMLECGTYTKLKKDLTTTVEIKINKALRLLQHMWDEERNYLSPRYSIPPQIYGLPKIHNDGMPLRSIVSTIESPAYVKNSSEFAQQVRETSIWEREMMVTFDVVSLITWVPVEETLWVISIFLIQDNTLDEWTTIPVTDICELIELCFCSTYFMFENKFFRQVEIAAMGSPLLPILANQSIWEESIGVSSTLTNMCVRYVNNMFVLWPHEEEIEVFHKHFSSQHSSIQFRMEKKNLKGRSHFWMSRLRRRKGRLLLRYRGRTLILKGSSENVPLYDTYHITSPGSRLV